MPDPDFRRLPTWLLSRAAQRAHRILHDELDQAGASGYEYRVLSVLHAAGHVTQAEIGRLAQLDRRDVTTTVRALVDAGIVRRRPSTKDARARVVSLTPLGRDRYRQLHELMRAAQDELLTRIPREDHDRLLDALARLGDEGGCLDPGPARSEAVDPPAPDR